MSLWIYKCNNGGKAREQGDWSYFFKEATRRGGEWDWGGPAATDLPSARLLAESATVGQQLLCWQRWTKKPDFDLPPGVHAAALGVVELVGIQRPTARRGEWVLRIVEQFPEPVPLLQYRPTNPTVDGIFRNPRQMGTFVELSRDEEREVRRICAQPRGSHEQWKAVPPSKVGPGANGAGFGDPLTNRQVEKAAVRVVKQRLRSEGWTVVSKERENVGYDLLATKGKEELHVEVKGIKGTKAEFILTANEARTAAHDPHWSVYVVTGALSSRPRLEAIPGADFQQRYSLNPVAYRASVRR